MVKKKLKKRPWGILFIFLFSILTIFFAYALYTWWLEKKSQAVWVPEFGVQLPVKYEIHGIDVSKYQEYIDWVTVRSVIAHDIRIGFAFIKATEGLQNEDAFFDRNWKKIREAGLTRGAYHFFLATKSGKEQAENFIHSVNLLPGDLPPVLDIEQAYGVPANKIRERVRDWLETVRAYYGITPIIYTNVDFYSHYLSDDFDSYPLWVAHYLQPEHPRIARNWSFWQHSEAGKVKGIYTRVDFNVFNGDSSDFRKILMN